MKILGQNKSYFCAVISGIFGSLGITSLLLFLAEVMQDRPDGSEYFSAFLEFTAIFSFIVCVAAMILTAVFSAKAERKVKTILAAGLIIVVSYMILVFFWFFILTLVSECLAGK